MSKGETLSEGYAERARHAMIRGMRQLADPVNCRETHPHDDEVECTLRRAHFEIEWTPHRAATGVEWFAAPCRCAFVVLGKPCADCGGSRRMLLDPADVEADRREEEALN